MEIKTRRGVYLNIEKSPLVYRHQNILFHFSSEFYLSKFILQLKHYEEEQKAKTKTWLQATYEEDQAYALKLYVTIEKRGFYIIVEKGGDVICLTSLNQVVLGGRKIKKADFQEQ